MIDAAVKTIVFDFDGVLVRDSDAVYKPEAWDLVLGRYGERYRLFLAEASRVFSGKAGGRTAILTQVFKRLGEPEEAIAGLVAEAVKEFDRHVQARIREAGLVPGALEMLKELSARRLSLYLNSGTATAALETSAQNLGIAKFFPGILGSTKSKVDNLRDIASREDVTPAEILVVGDGDSDLAAAQTVGCRFVGVANQWNGWKNTSFPLLADIAQLSSLLAEQFIMNKTVFFSIANPFILRNFLVVPEAVPYRLLKQGIRVIILVPRQAFDRVQQDFGDKGFIIEPITVNWHKNIPQRAYTFFSTYLNMTDLQKLLARCGTRNDIPVAGGRKFLYPAKLAVANTLGKWGWFRNRSIAAVDPLVYRERPYKELFEKYKPDLVFLPDFHNVQDLALLREAKRQRVKTIGMPGSWDHFVKRYEPVKLDTLLVWNEPVKKEATLLQGYKKENVQVTGSAYYDLFVRKEVLLSREEFCKKFGFEPKKKIIFFTSRGRYTPNDGEVVDIMLQAIKNKHLAADAQIFLRPYPGINTEHPKFAQFENEPLVYVDWIEPIKIFGHSGFAWYPTLADVIHFVNCLHHADIVVNTFSSVSVEASVFLKPIINIFFDGYQKVPFERSVRRGRDFPNFKHVAETGGIFTVSNADELINTINVCFKNPDINRKKVEVLRERMTFRADGRASERITGHIISALS